IYAGLARAIITPPRGIYLIGYGDRWSACRSVRDELTATALALDDGQNKLLIIALDMLALNERVVGRVRARITEKWGVPGAQVMLCCSHTHSGPIAYANRKSRPRNRRFVNGLVNKLADVAGQALDDTVPVTLAWGQGEARIAVNRRKLVDGSMTIGENPDGPVDRSLNVLQALRDDGRPLVTLVNFACHATVLGPSSLAVSADWPGAMRRQVQEASGAPCMFIQGATADLNPHHEWGDDSPQAVEQLGGQVARQVLEALPSLEPFDAVPLQAQSQAAWLPIVPQMKKSRPLTFSQALASYVGVPSFVLPRFVVDFVLNARYPWQSAHEKRDGQWRAPMEIQVLRLGDCALVAHAAETFNEIGSAV
ncbi:MAG: hypothetical protein GY824_02570, partial [Delftia sp.]|nr:hypothetical protein [Delftia sp.]